MATPSSIVLRRQLQELRKLTIYGPPDTLYEGAFLRALMTFPQVRPIASSDLTRLQEFPLRPPKLVFQSTMWHPSVYDSGDRKGELCISILHEPGVDPMNEHEDAGERWMPVHTVESILVSVISLLSADTPNTDSPANVDAAKEVRTDLAGYRKKVRRLARRSAEEAWD